MNLKFLFLTTTTILIHMIILTELNTCNSSKYLCSVIIMSYVKVILALEKVAIAFWYQIQSVFAGRVF